MKIFGKNEEVKEVKNVNNVIDEFFLPEEQEREIRAEVGGYHVYEPNAEFYDIINDLTKALAKDKESFDSIEASPEISRKYVSLILQSQTDLPYEVTTIEVLELMDNGIRKANKNFRSIIDEIQTMIEEAYAKAFKLIEKEKRITEGMTPKQKKLYNEMKQKKKEPVLTDKEIRKQELRKELEELEKEE